MEEIKLSYSSVLHRVKIALTPRYCQNHPSSLNDFLKRARIKLQSEKNKGEIDHFQIFEKDFTVFWQTLAKWADSKRNPWFEFTLGQGGRRLPGIIVEKSSKDNEFLLTVHINQRQHKILNWMLFKFNIIWALQEENLALQPNEAMLRSIFYRLKKGYPISKWKVRVQPSPCQDSSKSLSLSVNQENQEAYLYIFDHHFLSDERSLNILWQRVEKGFQTVQQKIPNAVLLKDELNQMINEMKHGPEALGLELPRAALIAISKGKLQPTLLQKHSQGVPQVAKSPKSPQVQSRNPTNGSKNSGRLLLLDIDAEGIEARIKKVNYKKIKNELSSLVSKEVLIDELRRNHIRYGYEQFLDHILNLLSLDTQIEGQLIAQGISPTIGENIYLHPVYLDHQESSEEGFEAQNLRNVQSRNIVKKGSVIAELRYRDGTPGRNIYGNEIPARAPLTGFKVKVGENVTQLPNGQFKALIEGMPVVDDSSVACRPVYLHEGDVNLSSGNIYFNGSAEISGNIESGAMVFVTGHLTVKGMIGQAIVRCGGDLTVQGGVITSNSGFVEVGARMVTDFIENSRITVHRDLLVRSSIINSQVICGGSLEIRDHREGVIGGGHIVVRGALKTAKLGFHDGKKTICHIGADWIVERRITIKDGRRARLANLLEREQRNLDELKSNSRRKSNDINERIKKLSAKIKRTGFLIKKLERSVANLNKLLSWNRDAIARVEDLLVKNVEIIIGGKSVPIVEEMKSVMITFHKFRGSRINPLELYDEYMKNRGDEAA